MVIRVLLVEDDLADAELTRMQFTQLGPTFLLDRVAYLEDAVARLNRKEGYHLVLLDLGLPGTRGLSALQSVMAADADMPVIVLTGHDDEATALAALREGAQDYLIKGKSTADTLVRTVHYALERGRLLTERVALEKQLAHAQRLEALGRFAGGISHEINNRLTPIIGMAEMLLAAPPDGDKVRRMAATILAAATDASTLVRNLLTYARHLPDEAKIPVDLSEVIEHSVALIRATLPPSVKLTIDLAAGIPRLTGNPTQLLSVILNLLTNAVDAMDGRTGSIALSVTPVNGRDVTVPTNPPLVHAQYLCLAVADDGVGMDEGTLASAFDPFFTSKAVDKGTGLGLSVVHGIVLDHQGAVALSSIPGRGTTIQLFLPVFQ